MYKRQDVVIPDLIAGFIQMQTVAAVILRVQLAVLLEHTPKINDLEACLLYTSFTS